MSRTTPTTVQSLHGRSDTQYHSPGWLCFQVWPYRRRRRNVESVIREIYERGLTLQIQNWWVEQLRTATSFATKQQNSGPAQDRLKKGGISVEDQLETDLSYDMLPLLSVIVEDGL